MIMSELSYCKMVSLLNYLKDAQFCSSNEVDKYGVFCWSTIGACPVRQYIGNMRCNKDYRRMVAIKLLNELDTDQLLR
jgi:hypothetical protein